MQIQEAPMGPLLNPTAAEDGKVPELKEWLNAIAHL